MTAHSPISPSKMDIWSACPGSVRFTQDIPDTVSLAAMEGTVAHLLGENALKYRLDPWAVVGTTVYVLPGKVSVHQLPDATPVVVTEEMAQGATLYAQTVHKLLEDVSQPELYVEKRVVFDADAYPDIYGTADAIVVGDGRLFIVDFKYGFKPVDACCNQLKLYAACALRMFKSPITDVVLVVVQPRADHADGPVRQCRLQKDELIQWTYNVLLPAVEATAMPNAPLVPGNHCTYCKGLSRCPAVAQKAEQEALVAFASVPVDVSLPPVQKMRDEQLASILSVAPLFRSWLDAVEAEVTSRLVAGHPIPGFRLGARKTHRRWKDVDAATQTLVDLFGDAVLDHKLKSPAQVEKIVKSVDKNLLDKFQDLCETPIGEPVAVPEKQ